MRTNTVTLPRVAAAQLPELDALLATIRTGPPCRRSPEDLRVMRAQLGWLVDRYGPEHPLTTLCATILAVELCRAEVIA